MLGPLQCMSELVTESHSDWSITRTVRYDSEAGVKLYAGFVNCPASASTALPALARH